jgi:CMP-N-acetylneuraminic acid synthetase
MEKIAAIVPMRHHSQRVPGKNFRELAGKPLFHHILDTLLSVPELDGIFIDTDSSPVVQGVQENFPAVQIIHRPQELCADDTPMNQIIMHDVSVIQAQYYLQTHSTNPLLKSGTISRAIQSFIENIDQFDSLFSVTRLQTRLYDQDGKAINHNPKELLQTQDLPPIYEENSCIYLFSEDSLTVNGHRIGKRPCLFEITPDEAWDIDTPLDFEIVNYLMGHLGE